MKRVQLGLAAFAASFALAFGCAGPGFNLPPNERLAAPGPGVDGPGPGVLTPNGMVRGGGEVVLPGAGPGPTAQVMFARPEGMEIAWDVTGTGDFGATPLVVPGRTNFRQAGLYRLKLQNIPNQEGVELYPTLEVGSASPRTVAFLAHNAIPIQFTVDDFNQVMAGNFVTKVIYLPDPDFQELAVAGVETLVSTRLDPGVDPIVEADRRGSILAVLRIGNKDIEMPGMAPEGSAYCGTLGGAMSGEIPGGYLGTVSGAPGYIAGVTASGYGMPITGTPIGLPGPPHIPLGGPAGLRKHVMRNHTHSYIPDPTRHVKIHVKQHPPVHYPAPRSRAWIHQYDHPKCGHCLGAGCANCLKCGNCEGAGCVQCRGAN